MGEREMENNTLYESLLGRRSIRSFKPDPIPSESMEKILKAAKYAPSAMGMQNRFFTVVQDQNLLKDIVSATKKAGGGFVAGHVPFYGAPAAVVVSGPENFRFSRENTACAIMNLMLAAFSFGIGSCYICSVLPGLRDPQILSRLHLPYNYLPFGSVSLGYPAGKEPQPKRRREDDVFFLR